MFRFNVVAVLCLGLLVSCGPEEPERLAPEASSQADLPLIVAQAQLQVSPGTLDFGKQKTGTSSVSHVVTVSNTGDATLSITALSISGPFSVSPRTAFTLAPGATQELAVTFSPTAQGSATGTLTLSSNDPATPQVNVALTGMGVAYATDVSPPWLDFGAQRVGTTSAALNVTVRNAGSAPLEVHEAVVNGPFSVSAVTPFTLAAGASQTLPVRFTPESEGQITGTTLTLYTNEPNRGISVVSLTGTGVRPNLTLNPSSLAFDDQRVGTTSTARTVTLSNTGTAPITLTSLSLSGPFSVSTPPAVPFMLEPGTSQAFSVSFSPVAQGTATGTLTLTSNDPDWASVVVALTGTGVQQPSFTLSPSSLAFGDQRTGTTSAALSVTVSNTGDAPLQVTGLSITGPFSVSPSTAFSLAAGASLALVVRFSPLVEGVASGTLTLTTNDPARPSATVPLTGTGVQQQPTLALSPTSLDFGEKTVGSTSTPKTVTVLNTGTSPLRITSVAIGTGEPFAVSPSAPFTLAPQESQALAVTFSPTAGGNVTGSLTLTTDDADKPIVTVALAGTGREVESLPVEGCACAASEGGSAGMLALLLLAGVGSRRRRHPHGTYGF